MDGRSPRALVLSAGGMFGAYQAGVWQELAEFFEPDIVVGASVGSLNGWHIASGCAPDVLAQRWLGLGGVAAVKWRMPRHFADGFLDNSALEDEIRAMCGDRSPICRLGIVMTHMRTLTPRLFEWPELSWEHVAASCAVPLFLRHYRIAGEWYSDGGLLDPLPLRAAIAMGARTIVTVNVLNHRPWAVRAALRGLRSISGYAPPVCESVKVFDISPDSPLGPVRDSMYWTVEGATRLVERGRQDAQRRKSAIVQWTQREIPGLGNVPYPSSS